jgi:hypothetical protein
LTVTVTVTAPSYCLVADILGFQKIVLNAPTTQREQRIAEWTELVKKEAERAGLRYQLISDTVFAVVPRDEDGLRRILSFSRRLLEDGLRRHFPLRGAVAAGEVAWSDELVHGPALVEAYRLETAQDWIGMLCDADDAHEEGCRDLLVAYPVPMKSGFVQLQTALRWNVPTSVEISQMTVGGNLTRPGDTLEHSWFRKMTNTALFGAYLRLIDLCGAPSSHFVGYTSLQLIETMQIEFMTSADPLGTWTAKLKELRPAWFGDEEQEAPTGPLP